MTDIAGYDYLSNRGSAWETSPDAPRRWSDDAACRGVDVEVFFDATRQTEAASYCKVCPVIAECLTDADAKLDLGSDAGFRAGMSGPARKRRRAKARKAAGIVVRPCVVCGGNFVVEGTAMTCGPVCRRKRATAQMRWRRG